MIAAGHGSRLQEKFPETIKPLVPLGGSPLISWPVRFLRGAGIGSLTVLFNTKGLDAGKFLQDAFSDLDLSIYYQDTGSSYESFRLVCRKLAERASAFIVTTVDALVPPEELAAFIARATASRADLALGVTDFIDDEKPLYAELDADGWVVGLGDAARDKTWITSGLYYMTAQTAAALAPADGRALRAHLGELVAGGRRTLGVKVAKSIDVDRPEDLPEAEKFVQRYQ